MSADMLDQHGDFLNGTGVTPSGFWRFIEERVFSLPGLLDPLENLSIFLTGSRSVGLQHETSDVPEQRVRADYENVDQLLNGELGPFVL